jgi:predicted NUDIX family NTP pyrophosphohydrolase
MPNPSAGILLYRRCGASFEVFLVHPGGPFWANRDAGAWSIPKGEIDQGADPLATAQREFREETGIDLNIERFEPLGKVRQPGGKVVHAWAAEGDCDANAISSNTFDLEWPRGSGKTRTYPEVDRAGWFALGEARRKILRGQQPLLDELEGRLAR